MAKRRRFAGAVMALAALLTLFAVLAGCSLPWQQTSQTATRPDLARDQGLKLVAPLLNAQWGLAALDPAQALTFDPVASQATSLLFDTLVTLDRKERIEPWGAQSWSISPDGLTYTFTLRPNQRFSDGAPVTASDYAWSLDRMANPCVTSDSLDAASFAASFLARIQDAATFHTERCADGSPAGAYTSLIGDSLLPDDSGRTLTIRLVRPSGAFLATLATPLAAVVERSAVTGANLGKDGAWTEHLTDGATGRGGSGMFYLASSASRSSVGTGIDSMLESLVFKPNPWWWGVAAGRKPHFSEVDFLNGNLDTFKDDASIAYADRIGPQTLTQQPDVRKQPYYHEQPLNLLFALEFNWKKAPFDDANARKAFCLAINRESLGTQDYLSSSSIPGWHIIPQGMAGYSPALKGLTGAPVSGDAARARTYWQAYLAAYGGQAPQVTFIAQGGYSHMLQALVQDWQEALNISVSVYVSPSLVPLPPAHQQLLITGSGLDYADPQDAFPLDFASPPSENPLGINVPDAAALLRQADALGDMRQRIPFYLRAERLFIDNAALCPLYQSVSAYALRPWVKGDFVKDGRGIFPNDAWVTGYITRH